MFYCVYDVYYVYIPVVFVVLQHPVYCVSVVGTQNAHNLISVSTDGKICSWSLDMLSQPQVSTPSYLDLTYLAYLRLMGKKNMIWTHLLHIHKKITAMGREMQPPHYEFFQNVINQLAKNAFHTQGPKFGMA